jgi:hypothetical protein
MDLGARFTRLGARMPATDVPPRRRLDLNAAIQPRRCAITSRNDGQRPHSVGWILFVIPDVNSVSLCVVRSKIAK